MIPSMANLIKHLTIVNYDRRVVICAIFRIINYDHKVLYKIGHRLQNVTHFFKVKIFIQSNPSSISSHSKKIVEQLLKIAITIGR